MQLQRVWYELHPADLELLERRSWAVPHELAGQVRLELFDLSPLYVSAARHREGSCVQYRGGSFFSNPLPHHRDASEHPLWAPLLASSIELAFEDDLRQVLAVRSPTRCVYCCSWRAGAWEADRLTLCRSLPRPALA